ncbi:MAG TPA: glycoside hydrolase family 31 protein [Verrucomicrobiae bacterium]|nr:glycoside hydrolase family 31 protein [Verrucomicrobiae bacterium]
MKFPASRIIGIVATCFLAITASAAPNAVQHFQKNSDGVTVKMNQGVLRLEIYSPRIVRVTYANGKKLPETKSFAVIGKPERTKWNLIESTNEIILRTDEIEARVNRATGAVSFFDKTGAPIVAENSDGGKSLTPNRVDHLETLRSRDEFNLSPGEAFYGLGQHGNDLMNYRGAIIHLQQRNPTESAVPVLISSRGYGIFWDNPAITDVDIGKVNPGILSWNSEAADAIDYYFMFGPKLDDVIASYRQLTGAAPMFGRWAWGFWQCKERYQSQQELLDVAGWYRAHHVPLDGIIQDWQYWSPNPWGSHLFDTNRYPDPKKLMDELHAENVHALISVWAKFDLGSANHQELAKAGALYTNVIPAVFPPGTNQWYDAFNSTARRIYWREMSHAIFADGFDGWWLDASEPELSGRWGEYRDYKTAAGPGATVFNAYPLMHTTAVYQGQRNETSKKRVFILTRSAYAGQQRNAAVTWSGDIHGDWRTFQRQIPAGLNFSISGIPYWNTDTGGFFGGNPDDPKYAELFTRWFQFSAFCPMFRVHGTGKPKEIWRWDDNTQKILIAYDELRYHLIPYIYSTAWRVTSDGYTMMRPLVMDFENDTNVFALKDEYLFGPSILVCPVIQPKITTRAVYLPAGTTWYDFWNGKNYSGGQKIDAAAPVETMPLFVRAGSIIPYGPQIEYATQKSDPIELRIYRGANGRFTLYEDEGDNYNYEKGKYTTIPVSWNEAAQTLEIGKRSGNFPGMLNERTFHIVWVSENHGEGIASTKNPDAVVHYDGAAIKISAPAK